MDVGCEVTNSLEIFQRPIFRKNARSPRTLDEIQQILHQWNSMIVGNKLLNLKRFSQGDARNYTPICKIYFLFMGYTYVSVSGKLSAPVFSYTGLFSVRIFHIFLSISISMGTAFHYCHEIQLFSGEKQVCSGGGRRGGGGGGGGQSTLEKMF